MRRRVVTLALGLAFCLGVAGSSHAMDLRDLPQWLWDMIEPVQIDWFNLAPVGVAPPVEPVGPTVVPGTVTAPGGQSAAVRGPALGGIEAVHIGGLAGADVQADEVHLSGPGRLAPHVEARAPGAADVGELERVHVALPGVAAHPQPVHVGDLGHEMDVTLGELSGISPEAVAKGGLCLTAIEERGLTPEEFVQWALENDIAAKDVAAAFGILGVAAFWRDADSTVLAALGAGLAALVGEDLAAASQLAPEARSLLAVHLVRGGRTATARRVLDSITQQEFARLAEGARYHLPRAMQETAPELSVMVLERHAQLRPKLKRRLCLDLIEAGKHLTDREVVESKLIPFAVSALEDMPPTDFWTEPLWALIAAYQFLGDHERALQEGRKWLEVVEEMGVSAERRAAPLYEYLFYDSLVELGRIEETAEMLLGVMRRSGPGSYQDRWARGRLLLLAGEHPGLGPFEELPAHLESVTPPAIAVTCDFGETSATRVEVRGNTLLSITKAVCSLEFAEVTVMTSTVQNTRRTHPIRVAFGPAMPHGKHEGSLVVETSDPAQPVVEIAVNVCVRGPIYIHPASSFLLSPPGASEQMEERIHLDGRVPFAVTSVKADPPDLVSVKPTRLGENRWLLTILASGAQVGPLEGTIEVGTDCELQPKIVLSYRTPRPARTRH
jgi:hypothetical protein